jgi:hypothetical protein
MKKGVLKILCVILILSAIISGCIEKEHISPESKIVSLKDLEENLDIYVGKNITVNGYIRNGRGENISQIYVISICNSNLSNADYCSLLYVPPDVIIYSGNYKITGIVGVITNMTIPRIDVISAELL